MPTIQVYVSDTAWETVLLNSRGMEISGPVLVGRLIDWFVRDPTATNRRSAISQRSKRAGEP